MTTQMPEVRLAMNEVLVVVERRLPRAERLSMALTPDDWDKLARYIDSELSPRWNPA